MTENNNESGGPPDVPVVATDDRQGRVTNWLLAAIVAVLVALVAVLMFRDRDPVAVGVTETTLAVAAVTTTVDDPVAETTTTVVDDTTTTSVADTTTTTVAETTTTTTDTLPEGFEINETLEFVNGWINAIASGDADDAWDRLAPESQAFVGTRSDFDEIFAGLQEGFGAWATADSDVQFLNLVVGGQPESLWVVTLQGMVTQEGVTAQRSAAIPVEFDETGSLKIQPFTRGELVGFVVPAEGESPVDVGANPVFEVVVPHGAETLMFVDSHELTGVTVVDQGDGTDRLTVASTGIILEVGGFHSLTVIYLLDGVVHADAVTFLIGE